MTGLTRGSAAIVGAAESDLGHVADGLNPIDLMAQGIARAVEDAGLKLRDIDGLLCATTQSRTSGLNLSEYLGISPRFIDTTILGGSSFMFHVAHAVAALQLGLCEVAAIAYGSTQRTVGRRQASVREINPFETPYRPFLPSTAYALAASRHMHEFGTKREQLAEVAVAARQWALLNPAAWEKKPLTVDEVLSARMVSYPFTVRDICLVTDGDADRVGGMDGRGNPLSTHQLICLLLRHYVVNRQSRGRVVKALTTTSMVDKMCAQYGLELTETGVGFKYIVAEMLKGGVMLGAEESGGIAFAGHIPERDGIAAGLMLLEMLATERKPVTRLIAELEKQFGPHHYDRIDTHFPLEKRAALMEFLKTNPPDALAGSPLAEVKSYDGVKFIAQDSSWLMLRGSGTEPILRIYSEGRTATAVQKMLKLGIALTKQV